MHHFSIHKPLQLPALAIVISMAGLSACAVDGEQYVYRLPTDAEVEQYNASVPAEDHIVCRQETSVKTRIPKRVCRLVRDIEETAAFHREQLRRALR